MMEKIKEDFNLYLESLYTRDEIDEMISYSLINNGKRLRPLFFLAIIKGFGYQPSNYFDIAASIEMIHTYSLVHDDLPEMDNDDYRHGKLASHKKYGSANAVLVGDALLSDAFFYITNSLELNDHQKVILIKELSDAIGSSGMVRGQFYDLSNDKENNVHHILDINYLKTSKLLSIPFIFAVNIANRLDLLDDFLEISDNLGLAFQIQDDILDFEGNFEVLGKTPLKDYNSNKNTYVKQFGLEKAKEKVSELFSNIYQILEKIPQFNNMDLINLIDQIKNRRK